MAKMPAMRFVHALTIGLGLVGVVFVGPIALDDPGSPPAPGPAPNVQGPSDQGPGQPAPPERRRHIDGDPMIER